MCGKLSRFEIKIAYSKLSATKGQLISEQIYAVLNFPKLQRNIARISALASKMGQIKKVETHCQKLPLSF